ncbi:hypothetical protein CRUP_035774 [Coryphaenoides rupestris]|nr:hypothetical protein CRUP_035774 [Coryphaenoides rupestris]
MSAAEEEEEGGGGEGEESAAGGGSGGSETSPDHHPEHHPEHHPDLPDCPDLPDHHPDHHPDHPDLPDLPDHHPDLPAAAATGEAPPLGPPRPADQPCDGSAEKDREEEEEEDREEEQEEEDREEEDREEEQEEDREQEEEGAVGGRPDKTFLAALHSDGSSSSRVSLVVRGGDPTGVSGRAGEVILQESVGRELGDLLNPCRCDGSVRYTHQHCLLKWISERGCWSCELCCYRFNILAINMKRPWQWQSISVTLVEKVQMVAVFLGSLFLMASITWLLWSALSPQALWQRRDVLFQICYGI